MFVCMERKFGTVSHGDANCETKVEAMKEERCRETLTQCHKNYWNRRSTGFITICNVYIVKSRKRNILSAFWNCEMFLFSSQGFLRCPAAKPIDLHMLDFHLMTDLNTHMFYSFTVAPTEKGKELQFEGLDRKWEMAECHLHPRYTTLMIAPFLKKLWPAAFGLRTEVVEAKPSRPGTAMRDNTVNEQQVSFLNV